MSFAGQITETEFAWYPEGDCIIVSLRTLDGWNFDVRLPLAEAHVILGNLAGALSEAEADSESE